MEERVLHAFFGGGGGDEEEEAFDLAGKTLVEWADEPEYNEEICRLARWQVCVCVCVFVYFFSLLQRQGIKAGDMAGRRHAA